MRKSQQNAGVGMMDVQRVRDMVKDQRLVVPHYQRDSDAWPLKKKQKLMESILGDFPVPPLYLYYPDGFKKAAELGDGVQRINAVEEFIQNKWKLSILINKTPLEGGAFDLLSEGEKWGGLYFKELPKEAQSAIKEYQWVVYQLAPGTLEEKRYMFKVINSAPTPLKSAELRNAEFDSEFLENVIKPYQKNPTKFLRAIGKSDGFQRHQRVSDLLVLALAVDEFDLGASSMTSISHAKDTLLESAVKATREQQALANKKIQKLIANTVTLFGENNVGAFGFRGRKMAFKTAIFAAMAPTLINAPNELIKKYRNEILAYYETIFKDSVLQKRCSDSSLKVDMLRDIRKLWEHGISATKAGEPIYVSVGGETKLIRGFNAILQGKNPPSSKIFKDQEVLDNAV